MAVMTNNILWVDAMCSCRWLPPLQGNMLHLQGKKSSWQLRQYVPPKTSVTTTRLCGVLTPKTTIWSRKKLFIHCNYKPLISSSISCKAWVWLGNTTANRKRVLGAIFFWNLQLLLGIRVKIVKSSYSKICDIQYWIIWKSLLTGKLTKSFKLNGAAYQCGAKGRSGSELRRLPHIGNLAQLNK
jgi:hypothetical protein